MAAPSPPPADPPPKAASPSLSTGVVNWSSRSVRAAIALLAVALAVVSIVRWPLWGGGDVQGTDDAYLQSDLTPLAPRVAAQVAEVRVTDFQRVKAGQLLVRLDDALFRAQLTRAQADVAAADAAIDNNLAQQRLQQAQITAADAAAQGAAADADRAGQDLGRSQTLIVSGTTSRQALDQAVATHKRSSAALAQAQAQALAARRQLDVLVSQGRQLRAALAGQTAARDLAAINLGYTRIVAPVDGMVGQRQVRAGQYAQVGTQLISLVPLPHVWVIANFKETQLARLRVGAAAEVTVDSFPGVVLPGRVTGWSPATGSQFALLPADNATGNFTKVVQRMAVRIDLRADPRVADLLRPGMSVVARVRTPTAR